MNEFLDIFMEAGVDTLKLIPFLFLTYVLHNDYPTSLLVAYVMMVSCVASEISSSPVT